MAIQKRWTAMLVALLFVLGACVPGLAADMGSNAPYVLDNDGLPMTAAAFLAHYDTELVQTGTDGAYGVLLANGEAMDESAYVATGQTLQTYSDADVLLGTRDIVVTGDVTGTGYAGLGQLNRLARVLSGAEPLEGIWLAAGDLDGSGTIGLADLVVAASQYRALQAAEDVALSSETIPLYVGTPDQTVDVSVVYMDGVTDVPYVSDEGALNLLRLLFEAREDPGATISASRKGGISTWTRENGSSVEFNFIDSTVTWYGFNQFNQLSAALTGLDVVSESIVDAEGNIRYIERLDSSFERDGSPIFVDLAAYGIDMVYADGMGYLPLQTLSDMFFATAGAPLVFNGDMVALLPGGSLAGVEDLYYGADPGQRSEALCEFSYNELCLAMDMFYGLSEQHDIRSFALLFEDTGLDERLKSPDPVEADRAIKDLTNGYLGDLHSRFLNPSFYAGKDADLEDCLMSPSMEDMYASIAEYGEARTRAYPDGVPGYEEVGNTAYVTFDSFVMPDGDVDYYTTAPGPDAQDTVGIIMYAHSRIMREDSPIENVVLDLSNNTGGQADAAVYTIGWFLGGEASICINDTLSGMQACTKYAVDVNADGICDATDSIAGKNLYCLTSPVSFSCGNLVPSALKASEKVTMIGRKSRGGACVVRPITAADGTVFRISGPWRVSILCNGSFYDVDKGVEPDHMITRIDRFYDREALTQYVNGLYR